MRIWFPLLLAPVLMLADQSISYAMAGWSCARQHTLAAQGVHFVFLVVVVVATVMAWSAWRATPPGNRHFLAGVAFGSGFLSALVIVAMWIPNWLISPCFS